jgi:hypothetical protein
MLKFNDFKENSLLESKEPQSFIELIDFLKTYEREKFFNTVFQLRPVKTGRIYLDGKYSTNKSYLEKYEDGKTWRGIIEGMGKVYSRSSEDLGKVLDYLLLAAIERNPPKILNLTDFKEFMDNPDDRAWLLDKMKTALSPGDIFKQIGTKISGYEGVFFSDIAELDIPEIATEIGLRLEISSENKMAFSFELDELIKKYGGNDIFNVSFIESNFHYAFPIFYRGRIKIREGSGDSEKMRKSTLDFEFIREFQIKSPRTKEDLKYEVKECIKKLAKVIFTYGFWYDGGKVWEDHVSSIEKSHRMEDVKKQLAKSDIREEIQMINKNLSDICYRAVNDDISIEEVSEKMQSVVTIMNILVLSKGKNIPV